MAPTLLLACATLWLAWQAVYAPPKPVTTLGAREPRIQVFGYSGIRGATQADAVRAAHDLYNAGRYQEAEAAAERLIGRAKGSADQAVRKQAAMARWVLAFSAARRRDLTLARERFALLRTEASELPDHGKPETKPGEQAPTLEEEGAYQHAVLTAALGERGDKRDGGASAGAGSSSFLVPRSSLARTDGKVEEPVGPAAAEREFLAFIRQYPESPLVHAAVQRIARLHEGEIPKETERAWQEAMRTAREREKQRARDAALCGPEVLVEVLGRSRGSQSAVGSGQWAAGPVRDEGLAPLPTVAELTRELGTDERGTSLEALAQALRKRGFSPKGLALTWNGLRQMSNAKCQLPNADPSEAGSLSRARATPARPGASHPHTRPPTHPDRLLIALIYPGHYVLVEATGPGWVRVWDPDLHGQGRAGVRQYYQIEWERVWHGVALVL